jgi:glyoxylase-like metal-dependent hydrolase (beta-lactamase superfamily II)/ferredoxin
MAKRADRLDANVDGELFVDRSCIDCDLCRQLAPEVFARSDAHAQSFVRAQPADGRARLRAAMALVTCPTASIGSVHKLDVRAATRALPEPIAADVYFCGWASASSYGAAAWLIQRPGGNVLVDSPRKSRLLFDQLDALGGVRTMFLTHRDDVADHRAFAARFGCERVIHAADRSNETRDVERVVDGVEPIALAADLAIVPVPGHTRGSCALVFRDELAFTSDHVWAADDGRHLEAGRDVCWYSWAEQRRSMARLAEHRFTHVVPGHGRRFAATGATAMRAELLRLAAAM